MKKVLITGAAGFIGFHTVIRLIKEGFQVTGIDDINDHYDPFIKRKRLEYLKNNFNDSFRFQKLDIRFKKKVEDFLKKDDYHAVVNLAARAGVRNSIINPWLYYETNTVGVLNILEGLKRFQPEALLIQASTSSVYGDNKVPFNESDRVDHPVSQYAASKKASEELCYTYHYLDKLNILIFRFFTVYGTFGRPDMSVFRFIRWIDEEKELMLYGDGSQERDFTYVDDIVEAIFKGINFKGYDIVNLGNDNPVKINSVIRVIEDTLNKKAKIRNHTRHPADILRTCAKIEKADKILGWKPKVKIEKGLEMILDWYKENKDWVKKVKL
ncbi:MAG: GDP-mannose 4,6-dehydratase [Spirochaetes bacterium]|nr:GDP-mannose 4,6-dehydratase [Spirochaetota bacterium]